MYDRYPKDSIGYRVFLPHRMSMFFIGADIEVKEGFEKNDCVFTNGSFVHKDILEAERRRDGSQHNHIRN